MIFLNCNIFQHFVQDVNRSKLPSRGQTQAFLEEEKYSDQNFSEVESAMRVQCTVSTLYSCAVLHSHIKGIVQCTVVHMCTTLCRAWLKVSLSQNPLHLSQPLQCLGIMNIIHLCSILSSSTISTPCLFRDFHSTDQCGNLVKDRSHSNPFFTKRQCHFLVEIFCPTYWKDPNRLLQKVLYSICWVNKSLNLNIGNFLACIIFLWSFRNIRHFLKVLQCMLAMWKWFFILGFYFKMANCAFSLKI